jgi:hypothetical protein
MVNIYPEEAERTGWVPMRKGVARPLMQWKLADLLKVAKVANWFPKRPEFERRLQNPRVRARLSFRICMAVFNEGR